MGEGLLLSSHCWWSSTLCRTSAAAIPIASTPTIASISSSGKRRFLPRPRASSKITPQQKQQQPPINNDDDDDKGDAEGSNGTFSSPDDLNFLWKLAAGSVGGAAVIKYGSALFPEITRPNIFLAVLMVGIPVIVSVILLIKQSSIRTPNRDPL